DVTPAARRSGGGGHQVSRYQRDRKLGRRHGRRGWVPDLVRLHQTGTTGLRMSPAQDVAAMVAGRPALLRDACRRALAYLDGLAERRGAPGAGGGGAPGRVRLPPPPPGPAREEGRPPPREGGSPPPRA